MHKFQELLDIFQDFFDVMTEISQGILIRLKNKVIYKNNIANNK